jgi:quercetin dioxygenase-like cupin family protein
MTERLDATRYRWDDLPEDHPLDRLDRRRIIGEKLMISDVFLRQGCHVPTHAHENEQFALVVSGRLRFGIGSEDSPDRYETIVESGEVMYFPSNVPHSATADQDTRILDVFAPPSETTGVDRA